MKAITLQETPPKGDKGILSRFLTKWPHFALEITWTTRGKTRKPQFLRQDRDMLK